MAVALGWRVRSAFEDGELIAVTGFNTMQIVGLGGLAMVFGAGILAVSRPGRSNRRTNTDATA